MEQRHWEFSALEKLALRKDAIGREIERLCAVSILDQAIRDTDHRGITRKEGEAADIILSRVLTKWMAT
jgi:hypothetical protein